MILLYVICGFFVISSCLLGYYAYKVTRRTTDASPLPSSSSIGAYEVNACRVITSADGVPPGLLQASFQPNQEDASDVKVIDPRLGFKNLKRPLEGLLIPVNDWVANPSSLLINGCIYTITNIERRTDFYLLYLEREHTYVFGDGLQNIKVDKWFKLHLLW